MPKMRTAYIPLVLLVAAFFVFPSFAQAQAFDFTGTIVPEVCRCEQVMTPDGQVSTAPAYGCVLQTLQNVIRFVFSFAFLISVLAFLYAGFLFMTAGANATKLQQGKNLLINVMLGIAIMLAAWLIVDFIMKTLYNGDNGGFGPWNSILAANGAGACIMPTEPVSITSGTIGVVTGVPVGTSSGGGGSNCPAASPSAMVVFPAAATQGEAERATATTVQNFLAMRQAAAEAGIDLKVTDGYRPESEQVSLWNQYCGSGSCGARQVARPCSLGGNGSNHNSGEAIDINVGCSNGNSSCNTRAYNWLKANGSRWGFRNAIPSDPVHWSPSGR